MYCTTDYINHSLTTKKKDNITIQKDEWIEKHHKVYNAKTQGMQKMKRQDYCLMQEDTIKSVLDLKIWNFLVNNFKKDGRVSSNGESISIGGLAKHFGTSRQKISTTVARAKKANFIQVRKRTMFLNPFVLVPYGCGDTQLKKIQDEWIENDTE